MKKLMAYSIILVATLASCTGTRIATYNDDVYTNPAEDRREQQRIAAENKKAQEAYQKRYNDSVAAVRTRENNNPYYKDPQYKSDDYYDYEYATRVKRFQNPVNGIGYYDNYYTNTYFYSGNPYQYGMSVYNGYNFWPSYNSYNYFPSSYFYNNYGWGSSMGFGYGNGYGSPYGYGYGSGYGYDPFGYNNNAYWMGYNHGYNSGFWGYPYGSSFGGFGSPYGYGYGGYGNPYGWGYYNSYDQNSGYTYAPRSSHSGGSDSRMSNPGMSSNSSYYQNYVQKVVESQAKMQKFTEVPVVARSLDNNGPYKQAGNGGMAPVYNNPANSPHYYSNPMNMPSQKNNLEREGRSNFPANNDQPYNNVPFKQPTYSQPAYSQPVKENPIYEAPTRQEPVRQQYEQPARNYEPPVFNNPPANNFPRGGGMEGGGGGRPR